MIKHACFWQEAAINEVGIDSKSISFFYQAHMLAMSLTMKKPGREAADINGNAGNDRVGGVCLIEHYVGHVDKGAQR